MESSMNFMNLDGTIKVSGPWDFSMSSNFMDCSDLLGHVGPLGVLRYKGDESISIIGLQETVPSASYHFPRKNCSWKRNVRGKLKTLATSLGLSKIQSQSLCSVMVKVPNQKWLNIPGLGCSQIFWGLKTHFGSGIYGEVGDLFRSCAFDKACSNQDLFLWIKDFLPLKLHPYRFYMWLVFRG